MNKFSMRSFLAGAVLTSTLTVGGLVLAQGDDNDGGMMGGGMMEMMPEMQEMMSRCNAMMDRMEKNGGGEGMMSPETKPEQDAS